MEGIKVLLNFHLDKQTRAEHRRLLHELAGEITERLECLDKLDEDEREKPGKIPHQKTLIEEHPHTHTHLPSKNAAPPTSPPPREAPPKRSRTDLKDETESPPTKKTRLNTENGKRHLKYIANGRISRPPRRRRRTAWWRWPPFLGLDPPFKQPNPQITQKHVPNP